ncbi:MAG: DUF6088 family protein [Verrucomicrobiales bacterium]|nr:DUF6088 family protein [Verrucomicrobiales bacterium]
MEVHPLYSKLPNPNSTRFQIGAYRVDGSTFRFCSKIHGVRIQPSGAYAANLLGLSEQTPAKIVFLTDVPSKRIKLGAQEISLKRTAPRNLAMVGRLNGLVIQALRYLGRAQVNEQIVRRLQRQLRPVDLQSLRKDAVHAPAWIGDVLRRLSAES